MKVLYQLILYMQKTIHIELIRKLRKGSHEAFNTFYDIYADNLYGFTLVHTKSPSLAEDIVQETFLKLWSVKEKLTEEGNFKSMLFTIASNLMIDAFRKQINKPEFEDYIKYCDNEDLADNSSEESIYYDEFLEKLTLSKRLLTEGQRLIFELSRESGLSNKEIAAKLDITEQTVKNHLSAALKTLRTELVKYNYLFALII